MRRQSQGGEEQRGHRRAPVAHEGIECRAGGGGGDAGGYPVAATAVGEDAPQRRRGTEYHEHRGDLFAYVPLPHPVEVVAQGGDGCALGQDEGHAASDDHETQGDDEGDHFGAHDDGAVEQTTKRASGRSRCQREHGTADPMGAVAPVHLHDARHDAGQRRNAAHGEVNAAGEDDVGHAHGEYAVDADLPREIGEVPCAEEVALGDDAHENDGDSKDDEGAITLQGVLHGVLQRLAAWRISSGSNSVSGIRMNSPENFPFFMASTRSLRPNSSGISLEISRIATPRSAISRMSW